MAFIDELKKVNQKVIFVRIQYFDPSDNLTKYIFVSDAEISIPENLVSGQEIDPEPRLESIPMFQRKIDIMDNKAIEKGRYSLDINNEDDFYDLFVRNKVLKNQKVEFFLTIKDYAPFDYIKLSEGTIKEFTINEQLKIKITEMNILQKNPKDIVELYNYSGQEEGLDDKFKPILRGKIEGLKLGNINSINSDDYIDSGISGTTEPNTFDAANFIEHGVDTESEWADAVGHHKLILNNEADAIRFRRMIRIGDKIKYSEDGDEHELVGEYNNAGDYEFKLSGYRGVNDTVSVLISATDSYHYNNKYYVSNNQDEIYVEGTLANIPNTNSSFIDINEDWNWIEAGDIILVEDIIDVFHKEEFTVTSYNKTTKTIHFEGDFVSFKMSTTNKTRWKVRFYKVQNIRIKEKVFRNKRFKHTLTIGSHDKLKAYSASEFGFVRMGDIKFKALTAGATINGNRVQFLADVADSRGSYLEVIQNENGVGYHDWIFHFSNNNYTIGGTLYPKDTYTTLKAMFDAYTGVTKVFSMTAIGWSHYVGRDIPSAIFEFLNGRTNDTSAMIFPYNKENDDTMYKAVIWFDKITNPGDPASPAPSIADDAEAVIRIPYASTYTIQQITGITNTLIWAHSTTNGADFPVSVSEVDEDLGIIQLKSMVTGNLPNTFYDTKLYNLFDGLLSRYKNTWNLTTLQSNEHAYDEDLTSGELSIDIDKLGLTLINNKLKGRDQYIFRANGDNGTTDYDKRELNVSDFSRFSKLNEAESFDVLAVRDITAARTYSQLRTISFTGDDTDNNEIFVMLLDEKMDYVSNSNIQVTLYEYFEVSDTESIYVYYKDGSTHLSDIITEINDVYNITEFSAADLTSLKTEHPNFMTRLIIDKPKESYKYLNKLLASFNLVSFLDSNGDIRYKLYNAYEDFTSEIISYYDIIELKEPFKAFEYSTATFKVNNNIELDKYTDKNIIDAEIAGIAANLNDFSNEMEIETEITRDFLDDTYNSKPYLDIFTKKYFVNKEIITFKGDLRLMRFELFDTFTITDYSKIDESFVYMITKIKTNGDKVEIEAMKINTRLFTFIIVDEEGNFIVDEFGNFIY